MFKNVKPMLLLVAVCVASATGLTFAYRATQPKITQQKEADRIASMREVLKEAENFEEAIPGKQWIGYKDGREVGSVIETSVRGYGGSVEIMVGVDTGKRITGINILYHTETPGLGAKITESEFLNQFRGKHEDEVDLKKDNPEKGRIDAITAATISSRAVVKAVKDALSELDKSRIEVEESDSETRQAL